MELTEFKEIIKKAENNHNKFITEATKGNNYYRNKSDIKNTGAAAIDEVNSYLVKLGKNPLKSADNRIPTNWHKVLVDQKCGYMFTYPPQFDTEDNQNNKQLLEKINLCLGDDYEKIIKQLCIDSSNCGIAWLAYWYNKGDDFQYYFVNPLGVIPIYDVKSVKPKMLYLIRFYLIDDKTTQYEVWDENEVTYFIKGDKGEFTQGETLRHTYGEIPFIPFKNNDLCASDLSMYKKLIDCIDKLVSGFANDIDDLQEIIWTIENYAGETNKYEYNEETGEQVLKEINLLQKLKADKFITVDEGGKIDAIRNEIPYEARSKFLEILQEQLFISAMAVNPNPERTGQATGSYIKFLYSLLELKAGLLETEYRGALSQLIKAILKYLNLSTDIKIEQKWIRNTPRNDVEVVQMIAQTPNTIVSDETKTKEHPLVENWTVERERIEKEQKSLQQNALDDWRGDE